MQSGAHMYNKDRPIYTPEEGLQMAKDLAKKVNCADNEQWLDCLRKVDAKLLRAERYHLTYPVDGTEFLPLKAQEAFNEHKFNRGLHQINFI